jgi:hypothetical protein
MSKKSYFTRTIQWIGALELFDNFEQVFEPHRMMHKHVKEGKNELTITVFCTEEKITEEILKHIFLRGGEGGQPDFRFSQEEGERRGMAVYVLLSVTNLFLLISTSCNYAAVHVSYSLRHCTNQLHTKPISWAAYILAPI